MKSLLSLSFLVALAGCPSSTPVKGVCCLGPTDCATIGLTEPRPCEVGQACVDNLCEVPDCSQNGCEATTPVCNLDTGACAGCTDSAQCSSFGSSDVCDTSSGACVQCVEATDCGVATSPICDAGTCRGCKLDIECASGACGDDGACVDEVAILYISPSGVDAGSCDRATPCRRLLFAAQTASAARTHIVMAPGNYVERPTLSVATGVTAPTLTIHGGGATLMDALSEVLLTVRVPSTIRDLVMTAPNELALDIRAGTVERVTINAFRGVQLSGPVTIRDVSITANTTGAGIILENGAALTLDGAVIQGGAKAITTAGTSGNKAVDIKNLLAFGTADVALDLANPSTGSGAGTLEFVTIADAGTSSQNGAGLRCTAGFLVVKSSIFWFAGSPLSPIVGGCTLSDTIAGPMAVPGAAVEDPLFVNAPGRNYHISPTSPARDRVDSGPSTDFEGDPRPRGTRFDLGADEAP